MRKALVAASIALSFVTMAGGGVWWVIVLSTAAPSIGVLAIVMLQRRFTRALPEVPWVFHVAAAMAVVFGVMYLISGAAHSEAVVSMALKEQQYSRVQIMRFTTGVMLLYTGVMNIALHRAIRTGRRWAVAVGLATGLLFWIYLLLLIPLPEARSNAFRLLGPWTVYLLWLSAAVASGWRNRHGSRALVPQT